jgi:hypothetical protein
MSKLKVILARCRLCGSGFPGEMDQDGLVYETRHPERASSLEVEVLCEDCYEATHPKEVPGATE